MTTLSRLMYTCALMLSIQAGATEYSTILETSKGKGQAWRYTLEQPYEDWNRRDYDDSHWTLGKGGFGTSGTPGSTVRTHWDSESIWLRREFFVGDLTKKELRSLLLKVHHDEKTKIYINGVRAAKLAGFSVDYEYVGIDALAADAIRTHSYNTIAVHCQQTEGGQYIDVGLVLPK